MFVVAARDARGLADFVDACLAGTGRGGRGGRGRVPLADGVRRGGAASMSNWLINRVFFDWKPEDADPCPAF